jgi:uncharacterized protein (DUF736 family)
VSAQEARWLVLRIMAAGGDWAVQRTGCSAGAYWVQVVDRFPPYREIVLDAPGVWEAHCAALAADWNARAVLLGWPRVDGGDGPW